MIYKLKLQIHFILRYLVLRMLQNPHLYFLMGPEAMLVALAVLASPFLFLFAEYFMESIRVIKVKLFGNPLTPSFGNLCFFRQMAQRITFKLTKEMAELFKIQSGVREGVWAESAVLFKQFKQNVC